ncbi:uncharacterized protein [Heliangelus exortis]|uniref:uncharacterized protein isoform X4 n=1 Tax=Heliangelus exortis TaxID=472823 RepID=UPI003A946898
MRMPPSHPCPRVPQLLASLLLLAGSAATQPQQVNVLLGDSVLLSPTLLPNMTVTKTEWSFSAGTGATILVAESISGGFMRPNPQDRFGKRLTMPNATALRIEALEVGDRGVYEARINLPLALVEEQTFNLFVYEISGWWRWHLCYLLLPVVAGASLGLGLWSRKKRKAARGGTFPAHPPQEALCRQIQRRSPQEQHNLLTTIYSQQDRDRRTPPRDQ